MTDYLRLAQQTALPQQDDTDENPYLSIARDQQRLQQTQVRTVIETALKDDPEIAAERQRLSQTSGLPLRVIERNLEQVRLKEQAKAIDLVRMASESPVLYRQLTDPTFTTTAIDDLTTLEKIEQAVGKTTAYVMGATPEGGLPSDAVGAAKTIGLGATVGVGKMIFDVAGVVNDLIGWDAGAAGARASAKRAQEAMDQYGFQGGTSTRDAIRSGLQSAGTNLALLPAGLVRGLWSTANQAASAVAGLMATGVGAAAFNRAREEGKNELQAGIYAIPEAAFEFVFERIPASKLFGDLAMNETLLRTLGKQAISEGWTEQVTTLAQDFNEWMNLNPDKTMGEFIAERPEAAYQTFVATLVGVGVQTSTIKSIDKIVEKASQQKLQFELDQFNQQMALASQSMLRQRSPEQFRALVQRVVDENTDAKKEIYVDGGVLNQMAPDLLAQLPDSVREQIPEAAASNSVVAIPMADVLTVAPGTPLEQILNDNARMTPESLSRVESQQAAEQAQVFMQQEAERVLAQAADQAAWQQSANVVKTTILDQLNQTGRFTADVNEAYATLQANFFSTMAARSNKTPEQLYRDWSLAVAARSQGGNQILDQITPEQAMRTNVPVEMPADPVFAEAVGNTQGAQITENGLLIDLVRYQKPEQEGAQAVRTGVFYLPTGAATAKHYRNKGTMASGNAYGGSEEFKGQTLIRRPLFVKGATGGKAPEVAYDTLKGKGAYQKMRADVLNATTGWGSSTAQKIDNVREMLKRYGADPGLAAEIVRVSNKGNLLQYAVQENIVAHAVREAGYDAVVGYSKGKAGANISEVFDVRELTFPARGMESQVSDVFNQTPGALPIWSLERAKGARITDAIKKAAIALSPTAKAARKNYEKLDAVFAKVPDPLASEDAWRKFMSLLVADRDVLGVPYNALRYAQNPEAVAEYLSRLRPDQLASRRAGFELGARIRQEYLDGRATAVTTGRLLLWAMLSRKAGAYPHEAAYMDLVNGGVDQWIAKAVNGTWTEADTEGYVKWSSEFMASKKGGVSPSAGVTSNANDFGRILLTKMSEKDANGETSLTRLHNLIADPEVSTDQVRREFFALGDSLGIQNKVLSFALLVTGRWDTLVLDRVQFTHLWGDQYRERAGQRNIYDNGLAAAGEGHFGLAVYEALSRGMSESVRRGYELAGLTEQGDGTLGAFHWDSWLIESSQAIGHPTIEALDTETPRPDLAVRQGKFDTYSYNFEYRADGQYQIPLLNGDGYIILAPAEAAEFQSRISDPKEGVVPKDFKVSQNKSSPWVDAEGVNRGRYDEILAEYGRRADAADVAPAGLADAGGPLQQRATDAGRTQPVGAATAAAGTDSAVLNQSGTANRSDVVRRAKVLGLPAIGTTEEIANRVAILESDPATWTEQDLRDVAPYLSIHQDLTPGDAASRTQSIMERGLDRGMVSELRLYTEGRGERAPNTMKGGNAYVFVSRQLRYEGNSPNLAPGNKPLFAITTERGQSFFDALKTADRGQVGDTLAQGPRGTFNPQSLLITLNETADLSTFLHESGHFFLEVLADLASQPNAPQQIKDDMATTLKWFGVPDLATWNGYTLDQKRQYHEKWAESFEQYLFEGKAPSQELQPLFRRFRSWLVNVYKSLKQFMQGRDLQLGDDIRQVFDRMIATDEQIAQAEEAAGMLPDFDATNEAIEKLQARSLRDLKWTVNARNKAIKALQKQAAELRKGVEAEVRAEVEQQPVYRAIRFLTRGEVEVENPSNKERRILDSVAGASTKLDLAALKEMYGEEANALWRYLSVGKNGLAGNNGMHPDIAADLFGFESGDKLVRAILEAESIDSVVEGMTDQRMLERHGDMVDQRAIEEAANEAVHNEARARSLATELKAQADLMRQRQDTGRTASDGRPITVNAIAQAAKEFGRNLAARRRLKDLRNAAHQHRAAEARAGKRWQQATSAGNTQDAVQAKRDQALNNAAVKALVEAQAEAKKIVEFFRKVTKGNNEKVVERGRDPDVVNAMRAILAAYGVAPRLEKSALEYMDTVAKNDPAMYGALKPSVDAALFNAKPLDEMTMEELRGLNDELRAMWELAKRSRQMEVAGNLMDIEDAAQELVDRMESIGIPLSIPGERGAITTREEAGIKLQFAKAILSRVEQWAERLDGKFGGPFLRLVFQPIKDAADRYRADRVAYRKKFTALVESIAPMLRPGAIEATELGYTFGNARDSGQAELLHAILHTGNESNKRKLLLGRGWATENEDGTLDTTRWDTFVERMINEGKITKAHYDFAQGVWDLLEEMKPLAQETHRKVFGRYFAEVTADAFVTPFGTYRGGYVPAQTDARIVKDAKLRELAEGENESMAYAFPASPSGFTKARVEYNKPLLLDLRALAQHMDKVLLFSHMQGAVTDVRRLLTQKNVSYALDRIDPGAYEGMLMPWLNRAARQVVETPVVGDRKLSRFLSGARSRAGMALMFANLSNTFQQITGFSMAAVKVKPSLMMSATGEFVRDPKALKKRVAEASIYMKDRMLNEVSAMNDAIEEIMVNPTLLERGQAWTQRHAYFMQAAVDNTMSPIIWTAAYNQAIGEQMSHDDAVRFADGVIRQTQGSTLPEDVSRFETGPGYARLFTQFVSYFNMMANTNATAMKQIADEMGLKRGAGKLLYVALVGLLVPIWVAEAIAHAFRGGPEDEDDDGYLDDWLMAVFGLGTLRGMVAQVPILGQAAQLVVNRFNDNPADDKFSLSPAVSLLESAVSAPSSVYKAIADDGNAQKAVRDVAAAATLITGLPIYGVARPVGYLAGMADDRIEPTGPIDLARGVVTGTASPESRVP